MLSSSFLTVTGSEGLPTVSVCAQASAFPLWLQLLPTSSSYVPQCAFTVSFSSTTGSLYLEVPTVRNALPPHSPQPSSQNGARVRWLLTVCAVFTQQ